MSPFFWTILSVYVVAVIIGQIISLGWQERVSTFFYAAVPVAFLGGIIYQFAPATSHELASSINIVALGDGTTNGGRYFLGAGNQTYAFMYRTQDGGFKMDSRQAQDSTIYEDAEPGTAHIEKWVGTNGFIGGETTHSPTYRIHIPPNSVVQGYNVDVTD